MIASSNTVILMLRQPRMNVPNESREDPFWEFGSFGCTGCHGRNLLHPKRAEELEGMRIAFAQGGLGGIRLIHLTPPVRVIRYPGGYELRWSPRKMPLKYCTAPIIIDNDGYSDVPAIKREIGSARRPTSMAQFASKFRSRREPVQLELAQQLETAYEKCRRRNGAVAKSYEEALPFLPPMIDRHRDRTYHNRIAHLIQFPWPRN